MLKTQTAKDAGVKIWQKPHQSGESLTDTMQLSMDGTWMIYSPEPRGKPLALATGRDSARRSR